ncbi:hypothetical protein M0804_010844 [Polistes exclamans]|nr:hypothetical protein M0804_010844 [Polistes exclamans]
MVMVMAMAMVIVIMTMVVVVLCDDGTMVVVVGFQMKIREETRPAVLYHHQHHHHQHHPHRDAYSEDPSGGIRLSEGTIVAEEFFDEGFWLKGQLLSSHKE